MDRKYDARAKFAPDVKYFVIKKADGSIKQIKHKKKISERGNKWHDPKTGKFTTGPSGGDSSYQTSTKELADYLQKNPMDLTYEDVKTMNSLVDHGDQNDADAFIAYMDKMNGDEFDYFLGLSTDLNKELEMESEEKNQQEQDFDKQVNASWEESLENMSYEDIEKELEQMEIELGIKPKPAGKVTNSDGVEFETYEDERQVVKSNPDIAYGENVLTEEQVEAVRLYSGGGYESINRISNGKYDYMPQEAIDYYKRQADILDTAIQSETSTNMIVYRGISVSSDDIDVGDRISTQGFTSTSFSESVSRSFAGPMEVGTVFEVEVPAGTKALLLGSKSTCNWECEILFGRKGAITVTEKVGQGQVKGVFSYYDDKNL